MDHRAKNLLFGNRNQHSGNAGDVLLTFGRLVSWRAGPRNVPAEGLYTEEVNSQQWQGRGKTGEGGSTAKQWGRLQHSSTNSHHFLCLLSIPIPCKLIPVYVHMQSPNLATPPEGTTPFSTVNGIQRPGEGVPPAGSTQFTDGVSTTLNIGSHAAAQKARVGNKDFLCFPSHEPLFPHLHITVYCWGKILEGIGDIRMRVALCYTKPVHWKPKGWELGELGMCHTYHTYLVRAGSYDITSRGPMGLSGNDVQPPQQMD